MSDKLQVAGNNTAYQPVILGNQKRPTKPTGWQSMGTWHNKLKFAGLSDRDHLSPNALHVEVPRTVASWPARPRRAASPAVGQAPPVSRCRPSPLVLPAARLRR